MQGLDQYARLAFAGPVADRKHDVVPFAELAFNRDSKADTRDIASGLNSLNGQFTIAGFIPDKTWGSADLGLTAHFDQQLSGSLFYNAHFSDSSQKFNAMNFGLSYRF